MPVIAHSDPSDAIADPRRRRILELLAEDERPVNDVVTTLKLPQPQVSKHLRALRDAGLVSVRGVGKRRLYRLNADQIKPMHDWIAMFEPFWRHQLDRIKQRAERSASSPNPESH